MDFLNYLGPFLFFFTFAVAIGYVLLIATIWNGWNKSKNWRIPSGFIPSTKISVLIAARNEEKHIRKCLESIFNNQYPSELLEVIVLNDNSSDKTAEIAASFGSDVKLISLEENKGKKAAIAEGVKRSSGKLMICTDADCQVPISWLLNIVSFYESKKIRLVAAPIIYNTNKKLVHSFQYLDGINNMCVTGSGIQTKNYYMANGANIAYEKSLFEEIGGFSNHAHLASGDDMFLIQEAAALDSNAVKFLKSRQASVLTVPENDWALLRNQRKRWATKTKHYSSKGIATIQAYVFGFVLLIFVNIILYILGMKLGIFAALLALLIKWSIDFIYLSKLSKFFENREPLKHFLPASVHFLFYILIAGWWALFPSNFEWKERTIQSK